MAAHHSLARYRGIEGLDAQRLLAEELDSPTRQRFEDELRGRGADPTEFHWLPVHPWQWDEVVVPVFVAEVAARRIVLLGDGPDRYLAQQSIRTFSNIDTPGRRHVKLPLSILNTLVWRGLPTERTLAAPAVTSWILGLTDRDSFLHEETRVVSPHGENAIVVFDADDVPTRLAVKDFVDDVNVSDAPLPELQDMPPDVAGVLLTEPPEMLCQFIQSGLFVGHFRYLGDLVETHLGIGETEFWSMVRDEIVSYQRRFPELAERFALFNLLAPDLPRLCLNRNRLLLDGYRDRPERPHAAVHGRVPNPLYPLHTAKPIATS